MRAWTAAKARLLSPARKESAWGSSVGIYLKYDPERARQLLAEAGYPGGRGFP